MPFSEWYLNYIVSTFFTSSSFLITQLYADDSSFHPPNTRIIDSDAEDKPAGDPTGNKSVFPL